MARESGDIYTVVVRQKRTEDRKLPFLDLKGGRVHYRFDGPAEAPVILLINSLGADLSMWDRQVPALMPQFRVLRYDVRGHGLSAVPLGPYTIEDLGRDALDLLDEIGIERAHVCGLSLGGVISQWLGIHASDRLRSLALCNTAARIGSQLIWNSRIDMIRKGGMAAIEPAMIERWFTADFISGSPQSVEPIRQMLLQSPVRGYLACAEALRDTDLREDVMRIAARTLVITGSHDPATPSVDGRWLSKTIPGARYAELKASHLSNIEAALQFNGALLEFLNWQ